MPSSPKNPTGTGDDPAIPILTDRLGFPPLEFDTTVPTIDTTIGQFEDADLNIPTVQPLEMLTEKAPPLPEIPRPAPQPAAPAKPAQPTAFAAEAPAVRGYPPPLGPAAQPPRSAPLPTAAPAPKPYIAAPQVAPRPPVAPTAPAAPSAAAAVAAPARPAAPAPAPGADAQLRAQIESELRNAVLRGLAERLPGEVEAAIRTQLAPAIDRLIEGLAEEARRAVAASVRQIVDRAVRAELDRLRPGPRGPS